MKLLLMSFICDGKDPFLGEYKTSKLCAKPDCIRDAVVNSNYCDVHPSGRDFPEQPLIPTKGKPWEATNVNSFSITKLLCKIGLHKYEDHITIGRTILSTFETPVEAKEICRWCKKQRREVRFFIKAR